MESSGDGTPRARRGFGEDSRVCDANVEPGRGHGTVTNTSRPSTLPSFDATRGAAWLHVHKCVSILSLNTSVA